jgi:hypothetical protein
MLTMNKLCPTFSHTNENWMMKAKYKTSVAAAEIKFIRQAEWIVKECTAHALETQGSHQLPP